ncbi:unnamed protein product, partial [Polarella glacialis]
MDGTGSSSDTHDHEVQSSSDFPAHSSHLQAGEGLGGSVTEGAHSRTDIPVSHFLEQQPSGDIGGGFDLDLDIALPPGPGPLGGSESAAAADEDSFGDWESPTRAMREPAAESSSQNISGHGESGGSGGLPHWSAGGVAEEGDMGGPPPPMENGRPEEAGNGGSGGSGGANRHSGEANRHSGGSGGSGGSGSAPHASQEGQAEAHGDLGGPRGDAGAHVSTSVGPGGTSENEMPLWGDVGGDGQSGHQIADGAEAFGNSLVRTSTPLPVFGPEGGSEGAALGSGGSFGSGAEPTARETMSNEGDMGGLTGDYEPYLRPSGVSSSGASTGDFDGPADNAEFGAFGTASTGASSDPALPEPVASRQDRFEGHGGSGESSSRWAFPEPLPNTVTLLSTSMVPTSSAVNRVAAERSHGGGSGGPADSGDSDAGDGPLEAESSQTRVWPQPASSGGASGGGIRGLPEAFTSDDPGGTPSGHHSASSSSFAAGGFLAGDSFARAAGSGSGEDTLARSPDDDPGSTPARSGAGEVADASSGAEPFLDSFGFGGDAFGPGFLGQEPELPSAGDVGGDAFGNQGSAAARQPEQIGDVGASGGDARESPGFAAVPAEQEQTEGGAAVADAFESPGFAAFPAEPEQTAGAEVGDAFESSGFAAFPAESEQTAGDVGASGADAFESPGFAAFTVEPEQTAGAEVGDAFESSGFAAFPDESEQTAGDVGPSGAHAFGSPGFAAFTVEPEQTAGAEVGDAFESSGFAGFPAESEQAAGDVGASGADAFGSPGFATFPVEPEQTAGAEVGDAFESSGFADFPDESEQTAGDVGASGADAFGSPGFAAFTVEPEQTAGASSGDTPTGSDIQEGFAAFPREAEQTTGPSLSSDKAGHDDADSDSEGSDKADFTDFSCGFAADLIGGGVLTPKTASPLTDQSPGVLFAGMADIAQQVGRRPPLMFGDIPAVSEEREVANEDQDTLTDLEKKKAPEGSVPSAEEKGFEEQRSTGGECAESSSSLQIGQTLAEEDQDSASERAEKRADPDQPSPAAQDEVSKRPSNLTDGFADDDDDDDDDEFGDFANFSSAPPGDGHDGSSGGAGAPHQDEDDEWDFAASAPAAPAISVEELELSVQAIVTGWCNSVASLGQDSLARRTIELQAEPNVLAEEGAEDWEGLLRALCVPDEAKQLLANGISASSPVPVVPLACLGVAAATAAELETTSSGGKVREIFFGALGKHLQLPMHKEVADAFGLPDVSSGPGPAVDASLPVPLEAGNPGMTSSGVATKMPATGFATIATAPAAPAAAAATSATD